MSDTLKPRDASDAEEAVRWAVAHDKALELAGSGSKRAIGRPSQTDLTLDLSGLSGVMLYEPEELILSAGAGTPLAEIEALLENKGQELAFEPLDYGPLLGRAAGEGTLGGVIAANLAGPRRIRSGAARDHFLGVTDVTGRGETIKSGGRVVKNVTGYDLCKVLAGSWGTLAAMTEITIKVLPRAEAEATVVVGGLDDARAAAAMSAALGSSYDVSGAAHLPDHVASYFDGLPKAEASTALRLEGFAPSVAHRKDRIIGAGIIPGGMEMMDRPAIHAVEEFVHAGYPLDVEALLIVELDGPKTEVDYLIQRVEEIARGCGAVQCRVSASEEERLLLWAGRKAAFPAVGRISPDYMCMDGTIPRAKLPLVLSRMREMSERYGLRVANVFHAGDGNLHPLILFDANKPGELDKTEQFGAEILKLCVEVGGVLTGEHGVGVEKRDLMPAMFSEIDLNQQQRVKCAFDEKGLLNPGKVFPVLHRCAELGRMHVSAGRLPFPDIPRF